MFSFRNSRQPNDHDADGYRAGEQDGKAAPLSPGIAVAATVFVQIRDWSRNCLTSLLVGHNMRDVPSAKAAIRRLERGRDKTAGTRCISEDVNPRCGPECLHDVLGKWASSPCRWPLCSPVPRGPKMPGSMPTK